MRYWLSWLKLTPYTGPAWPMSFLQVVPGWPCSFSDLLSSFFPCRLHTLMNDSENPPATSVVSSEMVRQFNLEPEKISQSFQTAYNYLHVMCIVKGINADTR